MARDFPELRTIGALFQFARALEEHGAELARRLAEARAAGPGADEARRVADKHARRADEMERARKEKMNETILEPLTGLDGTPFVPAEATGGDAASLLAAALDYEDLAARFYLAAVGKAGSVLAEVRRQFERAARDNAKHAQALRAG